MTRLISFVLLLLAAASSDVAELFVKLPLGEASARNTDGTAVHPGRKVSVPGVVKVGARPSGGAVLRGDREYAMAVRGENRVVFLDAASRKVAGSVTSRRSRSLFPAAGA